MEEYFGEVFFALIVKDKMTERPRVHEITYLKISFSFLWFINLSLLYQGTAFVKFVSSESAEKCVKASETDGIFLDTRQIYATMAIAKSDADQKQKVLQN